jgi:hypothetical protein
MQKSVWRGRIWKPATGDIIKQTNDWNSFSRRLYRHLTFSHTPPFRAACLVSTLRPLRQWNSVSLKTKQTGSYSKTQKTVQRSAA